MESQKRYGRKKIMTIYICCVSGFSSSILAKNLEAWLGKEMDEEVFVESTSYRGIKDEGEMADLILLAPQLGWTRKELKTLFPDTPVFSIDSVDYGRGRAEPVGRKILDHLAEKNV